MNAVALGELVTIKGGGTPDKSIPAYWGGSIPWASVKDFKSTELSSTEDQITELGVANSATNIIPAGTIIVPTRMAVGKVAINTIDLAINQDLKAIFPGPKLDGRYLLQALLAGAPKLIEQATGATVKGIKLDVLKALTIPVPSLDEQRRIANILEKADTLRCKRKEALVQLDQFVRSIFYEAFIAQSKLEWPVTTISDVASKIRTGPFGSQLLHSEFVENGVAVLGIDNAVQNEFAWDERRYISAEKYRQLERYTVRSRDVLITIMGTCGRCAIVPDDIPTAINTKHLCCITLDETKVIPEFLHSAFLMHPLILGQLESGAKGAVMPGLNMGKIKSLVFPIPPISIQNLFRTRMVEVKKLRKLYRAQIILLDDLFSSLQHRAFRGEL
jgi:type I restriction enzyme, S subunit